MISVYGKVENTVGKGENARFQHFSHVSPFCFGHLSTACSKGVFRVVLCPSPLV